MTRRSSQSGRWQRVSALRLRREAWGGIAFHRDQGDLLELDQEGFTVLTALSQPHSLVDLRTMLHGRGYPVRLPELAAFLRELDVRRLIRPVDVQAESLPPDPWTDLPDAEVAHQLRAPLVAHWAVTYRCNLQCRFCYSESGPWREPGPGAAVRRRLVERLAAWGLLEVALGGGEPTILPDFPDLLQAIREAGMVPNVTTNGTNHSDSILRAFADHAGVVHLSADLPELLDAARGPGVYERLCLTATRLRNAGVRIGINLLLTPANAPCLGQVLERFVGLGVQTVTLLRPKGDWAAQHWPGFPSAADMAVLAAELAVFMSDQPPLRLYVDTALRSEWDQWGLLTDPEPDVLGCGGGQRHVAITPDGEVYPCSHARRPEYRMGHLLEDDLETLWLTGQGRKGRQLYERACQGVLCPCRETSFVDSPT